MTESLELNKLAMVFPGQGSQFVGMGRAYFDRYQSARQVFEQADAILGFALSRLCFDGPAEELEDTLNAQPAILTASVAMLETIGERARASARQIAPLVVAGQSLGEFTALVAAEVLDFPTALRLVRERGRLMKEAGRERPGGMAAILGLDEETLAEICAEAAAGGVVVVANANCPGQTVISGEFEPLARAMELAKMRGAKRATQLKISIASHSPLMASAAVELAKAAAELPLRPPSVPIVGNVSGEVMRSVDDIRQELAHQVERPVNWTRSVQTMASLGPAAFLEVGPGQVLSGLIKRIDRAATLLNVTDLGLGLPLETERATS